MKIVRTEDNGVGYAKGGRTYPITMDMIEKNKLTERERAAVIYRLGFDGNGVKTMAQVAQMLSCSRERIRILEDHAFRKLKYDYPFSKRAISVLEQGEFIVNEIILNDRISAATPEKIRSTKGCSTKVYNEIMEYKHLIMSRKS